MKHTSLLVPAGLGGGNDVGGDVGDVLLGETSTEGGHGVLAVGDLGDDRGLLAAAGEVLVEGLLLEGLLGHDDVLSAGVASGAVGVEDLLTGSDVTGEGRGGDAEGEGAGDGTDLGGLLFGVTNVENLRKKVRFWKMISLKMAQVVLNLYAAPHHHCRPRIHLVIGGSWRLPSD